MKKYLLICILNGFIFSCYAQTDYCPADPPINVHLADSPWPIYHRNNYAQSSTCIRGPQTGDSLRIKYRGEIRGNTSPWVYLTEKYADGQRAMLYSNATFVFKLIDNGETIEAIDSLRIDYDLITSFGWNFLLGKNKVWYTYDPKYDPEDGKTTRLFKLTDEDTADIYSDIIVLDTFDFGDYGINKVQHYNINYDGHIVFNSDNDVEAGFGTVGVITQDFELLDTLCFPTDEDEITNHNAFPIDEFNSFYITTNKRLLKFDWDGENLSLDWEAPYDFVGDGPTGTFAEGSGTTPTLMGWGEGNDKLVVMSDGHARNNLVAFWRELPPGWTGIPGMDIHFADSIQLPAAETFSPTFQSIENSPTVRGYDIAIAQFNGFLGYDCENFKGVQKLHWNESTNAFELDWVNTDINMNGVLTYSSGSDLVYCSGKESDCNYYYYGLNWQTGALDFRYLLGPEGTFTNDPFYDAGNNNLIDEDGNILFAGGSSLVKIEVVERSDVSLGEEERLSVQVYPNPAYNHVRILAENVDQIMWYSATGQPVYPIQVDEENYDISQLAKGVYWVSIQVGNQHKTVKVVKG